MFAESIQYLLNNMADSQTIAVAKTGSVRFLLPDVLKGLAVLLMIQVHLMELFARPEIFESLMGRISLFLGGPPAAPVFMAVMGYFLSMSGAGTVSMIARGFRLILYGFLLNTGLNFHLLYHIVSGESALNPLSYIFGVDILFLAGLSVIVIALLRKFAGNSLKWWLLFGISVPLLSTFLPSGNNGETWSTYLMAFFFRASWWSYFPMIPWLAYPVAGYCFRLIEVRFQGQAFSQKTGIFAAIVLFAALLGGFSYGFGISADLPAYYGHNLLYFLWALVFLILWSAGVRFLLQITGNNYVTVYLQWIGRNVTAFYVLQWLIIGNLATSLYKTSTTGQLILWYTAIVIITSVLIWLYQIVRAGNQNSGKSEIN